MNIHTEGRQGPCFPGIQDKVQVVHSHPETTCWPRFLAISLLGMYLLPYPSVPPNPTNTAGGLHCPWHTQRHQIHHRCFFSFPACAPSGVHSS